MRDSPDVEDNGLNYLDKSYSRNILTDTQFFTANYGFINGRVVTKNLNNAAIIHALTRVEPCKPEEEQEE